MKKGLFIIAFDFILGLYLFLYEEYRDGMTFLFITSHFVVVFAVIGLLFCLSKRTRMIGYLLIANVVILPVIFFMCVFIGSSIFEQKEAVNNIIYNFTYENQHYKLIIYKKNEKGLHSNKFVLDKYGNDSFWSFLTGSYYLDDENNCYLIPDSIYLNDVGRNKNKLNKKYPCCDTIVLRNDTLYGLYSFSIYINPSIMGTDFN